MPSRHQAIRGIILILLVFICTSTSALRGLTQESKGIATSQKVLANNRAGSLNQRSSPVSCDTAFYQTRGGAAKLKKSKASPSPATASSALTDLKEALANWQTRVSSRTGQVGPRVLSAVTLLGAVGLIAVVGRESGLELIVVASQAGMYHEVAELLDRGLNYPSAPLFRWSWFILALSTAQGLVSGDFSPSSSYPAWFTWMINRQGLFEFLTYLCLLAISITPAKEYVGDHFQRQLAHLAGLHFALFFIVGFGSGYIGILRQFGARPFLLSALLVVVNDIGAYLVGVPFGKTPLTKLSPKKTWEGYVGGALITLISGPLLVRLLKVFMGPTIEDQTNIFGGRLALSDWQALILAAFASFGAPLGGFLASATKRSVTIKDFSQSIPGHGGIVDRMDCQVVMSAFAYLFLLSSGRSTL